MKTFNEIVNGAETGRKAAIRALQGWQFLISKAHNRQIVRYGDLAAIMGYSDNRPLTPILGHIMHYCVNNGLPPLTIIVVSQDGTPSEGFTAVPRQEFDQSRENVFGYDWFGIVPPSVEDFIKASAEQKLAA